MLAVRFDSDRLEVTGAPVPLIDEVQQNQFAISDEGGLVYGEGGAAALAPEVTLTWVDRQGGTRPLTEKPGSFVEPRLWRSAGRNGQCRNGCLGEGDYFPVDVSAGIEFFHPGRQVRRCVKIKPLRNSSPALVQQISLEQV